jgi:lipoic acid synthetase
VVCDGVTDPNGAAPAEGTAHGSKAGRMPGWMRRPLSAPGRSAEVSGLLDELGLNTVCRSAKCPNRGECYASGTATFMVLGTECTRNCRFCAVEPASPSAVDAGEPARVAEAAERMALRHVVVTMVTRDDLPDGGAAHVVATIAALRGRVPAATVEVLVSDFGGDEAAIDAVALARPDVFNHNVETVPRLYATVRPQADYARSLRVLARAKAAAPGLPTKSGLMVGLGETPEEVEAVMRDLREAGVDIVTIGQYLRPSAKHLEVAEFVAPEVFERYAAAARALGFTGVASAPFVRSSYHAADLAAGSGTASIAM